MAVRRLGPFLVILALVLATTGCGLKPEPTGATGAAFPVSVVDATGSSFTMRAAPDRVVSADPGATAILRQLGFTPAVPASMATLLKAAADPSVGLIVVPITLTSTELAALDSASTAPIFRYGARPLTAAPTTITQLGLAVGRGPAAAAIAERVARGLRALADRIASLGTVRTLVEGSRLRFLGAESPLGLDVTAAGGVVVGPAGGAIEISAVPALNVAAWVSSTPGGTRLSDLQRVPELSRVPAIAESRFASAPLDGYPIDAQLPAALAELASVLHGPALN